MDKPNNGGGAFPQFSLNPMPNGSTVLAATGGMTLRDWFAGQALAGIIAQTPTAESAALFAREAYVAADAMLAAREAKS